MLYNSLCPISGDGIHVRFPVCRARDIVDSIPSQPHISPVFYRFGGALGVAETTDSGKYELVAKCRNLAVRVIWGSSIIVYRSAVSSHYKLIFGEIENNRSPRNDLGVCRIRHKHDEHVNIFRHVALSSGAASSWVQIRQFG